MRVGAGKRCTDRPRLLSHDAVREADGTIPPVIVASAQQPCPYGQRLIDRIGRGQAKLREVEGGVFVAGTDEPHEVVEDLGDAEWCEHGVTVVEQEAPGAAEAGSPFEQGKDGVGVEED